MNWNWGGCWMCCLCSSPISCPLSTCCIWNEWMTCSLPLWSGSYIHHVRSITFFTHSPKGPLWAWKVTWPFLVGKRHAMKLTRSYLNEAVCIMMCGQGQQQWDTCGTKICQLLIRCSFMVAGNVKLPTLERKKGVAKSKVLHIKTWCRRGRVEVDAHGARWMCCCCIGWLAARCRLVTMDCHWWC